MGINAFLKSQSEPPWPDAIIEFEGKEIGLEHTELFKSKSIQAVQKFANTVIQSAYENYQGPASSINLTFDTGKTKEKPENIGKKLAAFINQASNGIHHDPVWEQEPLGQIKQIRIQRYPDELNPTTSAWRPEFHLRHESIVEALRTSISEKESKRKASYEKLINPNWLLITMRSMQDSQFFPWMPIHFDGAIVNTEFERILLCDITFGNWYDIPPK